MHDRLDHYDDRALTPDEAEATREPEFVSFSVRCINAEGAPPPLRAGARYLVIGEVLTHIDGRPLDKRDERWILSVGEAAPQEFFKSRFVPEDEFKEWRLARVKAGLASLRAELDAIGEPDARF